MQTLKDWFNWFITSSSDPLKFSMTVRGTLLIAGSYALKAAVIACGLGIYCLGIDQSAINQIVDSGANLAQGAALIVGSVMAVIGIWRKFKNKQWSAA
jgi:hypothetical protein